MKEEDDDLLEIYNDNNASEYNYFDEARDNRSDIAYGLLGIAFLVVIGIKFFMSLPGDGPNEDAINIRRVHLLNVVKNSNDDAEKRAAIIEYDSLQRVLDGIDRN